MADDSEWAAAVYGTVFGMDEGFDENPAHRIEYVDAPLTPFEKVAFCSMIIVAMAMVGCTACVACRECMRTRRRRRRSRLPPLDDAADIEAAGHGVVMTSGMAAMSRPAGAPESKAAVVLVAHPDDHVSLGSVTATLPDFLR